jgi:hypothetical protein
VGGPGGSPIAVDVMTVNMLLTPANLERLTDVEVEAIRSAAAMLALHAPQIIEAVATPIAEVVANARCPFSDRGDGVDAFPETDLDGTAVDD